MKAMLEFNLPEEEEEFALAVDGAKYSAIVDEIKNMVRSIWKYEELDNKTYEVVDRIYESIFDIISDHLE